MAGLCLGAFIFLECASSSQFGWRQYRHRGYDLDRRRLSLHTVRYRVLASFDIVFNAIWHAFLLWWAVRACLDGWQPSWVAMAILTVVLYAMTTLVLCKMSRATHYGEYRPRVAWLGACLGLPHWMLSFGALIMATQGWGSVLLPSTDTRFALQLGVPSLLLRLTTLCSTVVLMWHAKGHHGRRSSMKPNTEEPLPPYLAEAVTEAEAHALRRMADGTHILLSIHGQRPRPHFLQLNHFSVLRWSWRGTILVHEIQSLHAHRHAELRAPTIGLSMSSYGVAGSAKGAELVFLDRSEYRAWMLGLQALRRAMSAERARNALAPEVVAFIFACFRNSDPFSTGQLTAAQLLQCFTRLNVTKTQEWADRAITLAVGRRNERSRNLNKKSVSKRGNKGGGGSAAGGGPPALERSKTLSQVFSAALGSDRTRVTAPEVLDIFAEELVSSAMHDLQPLFDSYADHHASGPRAAPLPIGTSGGGGGGHGGDRDGDRGGGSGSGSSGGAPATVDTPPTPPLVRFPQLGGLVASVGGSGGGSSIDAAQPSGLVACDAACAAIGSGKCASVAGGTKRRGAAMAGQKLMSREAFYLFLRTEQGVESEAEMETAWRQAVARRGAAARLAGGGSDHAQYLDEAAFRLTMLSPHNDAFDPATIKTIDMDMSRPLTDYFCNSSHNSYLEGVQYLGNASVNMYKRQLLMGCRCVELDCFDGKDGSPEIRHGNTIVKPIKVKDVLQAVLDFGFVASPYPVVLSLEMHLSPDQQERLVDQCTKIFGERLMWPDEYEGLPPAALPSPEDLRGKVLLKAKKRRPAPHETLGTAPHHADSSHSLSHSDSMEQLDDRSSFLSALSVGGAPTAAHKKGGGWLARLFGGGGRARPQPLSAVDVGDGDGDLEADHAETEHSESFTRAGRRGSVQTVSSKGVHTWTAPRGGIPWSEALSRATYLPSTKFKEPLAPDCGRSPYEISSISEGRINHLHKDGMLRVRQIAHNTAFLTRIYPDGVRQDSSNLDPSLAWSLGSHMVCLNFQTWDINMRLNFAKFLVNGSCGYVPKPPYMLPGAAAGAGGGAVGAASALPPAQACAVENAPDAGADGDGGGSDGSDVEAGRLAARHHTAASHTKLAKMLRGGSYGALEDEMSAEYTLVHVRILLGRQLPKTNEQCGIPETFDRYCAPNPKHFVERIPSAKASSVSSPLCVVEAHGGGKFRCVVGPGDPYTMNASFVTKAVPNNGCTPRWDEECECVVEQPGDAILSIHVHDRVARSESSLIGYSAIPMDALRTGWRVIKLRSPTGSRLVLGSLLVHISRETRKGTPANMKAKGRPGVFRTKTNKRPSYLDERAAAKGGRGASDDNPLAA